MNNVMRTVLCGVVGAWLVAAPLAAAADAALGHLTVTDKVDMKSMQPARPVAAFPPDTSAVWAAAQLTDAPAGTRVGVRWIFEGGDKAKLVNRTSLKARGTRSVAFRLTATHGHAFTAGPYAAQFFLNDHFVGSVSFTVGEPRPAAGGYARFVDPNGRFQIDLPVAWLVVHEIHDPNAVIQIRWREPGAPLAMVVIKVYDLPPAGKVDAVSAVKAMRAALLEKARDLDAKISHDAALAPENPQLYVWALGFLYRDAQGREIDDRKQIYAIGDHLFVFNFIAETTLYPLVAPVFAHILKSFGPASSS